MKKNSVKLILAVLFALSIGTTVTVFGEVALAGGPPPTCPKTCVFSQGCVGTTCTCTFDSQTSSYYCASQN